VNVRGFMQIAGDHCNSDRIYSYVTNEATIRVVIVLSIVFRWTNELVDVKELACVGIFIMKNHLHESAGRI